MSRTSWLVAATTLLAITGTQVHADSLRGSVVASSAPELAPAALMTDANAAELELDPDEIDALTRDGKARDPDEVDALASLRGNKGRRTWATLFGRPAPPRCKAYVSIGTTGCAKTMKSPWASGYKNHQTSGFAHCKQICDKNDACGAFTIADKPVKDSHVNCDSLDCPAGEHGWKPLYNCNTYFMCKQTSDKGKSWGFTTHLKKQSTAHTAEGAEYFVSKHSQYSLGGHGYDFTGPYKTKGLYVYTSGKYKGMAFFGTGGTEAQMNAPVSKPKSRVNTLVAWKESTQPGKKLGDWVRTSTVSCSAKGPARGWFAACHTKSCSGNRRPRGTYADKSDCAAATGDAALCYTCDASLIARSGAGDLCDPDFARVNAQPPPGGFFAQCRTPACSGNRVTSWDDKRACAAATGDEAMCYTCDAALIARSGAGDLCDW